MRTLTLLILAMLVLPFAASAQDCTLTNARVDVDTGETPAGRYYYVEDCGIIHHPCLVLFSVWIYEESNGIDGLQRHDEVVDNTCGGLFVGDSIVF